MLLYDADCGFCTRAAVIIRSLHLAIDVRPLQSLDLDRLGVSVERASAEIPFVDGDGRVSYGHEAIADALRHGPWLLRLFGSAILSRALFRPAKATYGLVARNRHRLPGTSPACRVHPAINPAGGAGWQ